MQLLELVGFAVLSVTDTGPQAVEVAHPSRTRGTLEVENTFCTVPRLHPAHAAQDRACWVDVNALYESCEEEFVHFPAARLDDGRKFAG